MSVEKRIYAIFAQTVQPNVHSFAADSDPYSSYGGITQPCGRILAQAVHVGRLLGYALAPKDKGIYHAITTITLAARDSKEMEHVCAVLDLAKIPYEYFRDSNGPVYGEEYNSVIDVHAEVQVMTAIITWPIDPDKVKGLLDYLPLWRHSLDVLK
jgi:hypothetical protein